MPGEDAQHDSGAEEYVIAEIELAAPLEAEQEKALRDALEQLDAHAFAECDIGAERISFTYDPTRTKKGDLLQLIERAGGKSKHVESEGSPLL